MTYQPEPIETSIAAPTEGLRALTELLARNVHENWASARFAAGWTWGPRRDDDAKTHPDLVPYDQLGESKKDIDRRTAGETVKALLALGYRIEPAASNRGATDASSPGAGLGPGPGDLAGLDLTALLALWRGRDPSAWSDAPEAYRLLAERLRAAGEPLLACDVVEEALARWPDHLRLRQLHGLALADSGVTERANSEFAQLLSEGHEDEETVGMLARTHKDLWTRACNGSERTRHLQLAQEYYETTYRRTGGYWTGINAATLAALQERESAATLAAEVFDQCLLDLRRVEREGEDRYWALATLGEACLVMRRWEEAADWYQKAADAGRGRGRDLSSTRGNARLLLALRDTNEDVRLRIEACFHVPSVIMFAGHMIDRPDRRVPRFPRALEPVVAQAIRERMESMVAPIGFASAACGSDLLFLEAVLDLGGEINVVLPYDLDRFEAESVSLVPGGGWPDRFRRVLEQAARVVVASERCETPSPAVYDYGNRMVHGLARIRASQLETDLRAIAVWDGTSGDGPGGTAAQVLAWQTGGLATDVVDLRQLLGPGGVPDPAAKADPSSLAGLPVAGLGLTGVKAMLFADAAGFSKLSDEQIPSFVQRFLGAVGDLCRRAESAPVMRNTWGDGLFFVFDTPSAAGNFAIDLCETTSATDWTAFGLPSDMSLRIGLHAGPVYEHVDPVTGRPNYSGAHVSRAARIEPITPTGHVYASEPFAALCAAEGEDGLICDYVGQTPLAKGFGTFRTYHVRRRPC